jgi:hypothetical protein
MKNEMVIPKTMASKGTHDTMMLWRSATKQNRMKTIPHTKGLRVETILLTTIWTRRLSLGTFFTKNLLLRKIDLSRKGIMSSCGPDFYSQQ